MGRDWTGYNWAAELIFSNPMESRRYGNDKSMKSIKRKKHFLKNHDKLFLLAIPH